MMQKAEFPTGGIVRDPRMAADLVTGSSQNSRTDSKVWMREEHAYFIRAQCPGNISRGFLRSRKSVRNLRGIFFKKKAVIQDLQRK